MKKFELMFAGRQNGSMGITYPIQETIEAETLTEAVKGLYKKYEHISRVRCLSAEGIVKSVYIDTDFNYYMI